ncbi:MAG TPA: tannase/feruloyl esterase family alpha/beta hydrolase [Burkholderiales bacterium]|nr:tannase/feruloyl esterase family alpha/beta hydrolase [Burkholderiales bacterium]
MVLHASARVLLGAFALSAGIFLAPRSQAHQDDPLSYSLAAPGAPLGGYVTSDTVTVDIGGPARALRRAVLTLNGRDVTRALGPGDSAGSMTASVSGLSVGSNTFRLYESKGSREPVAMLVIERATAPAVACEALAAFTGFPIQPSGAVGGTTITLARLNPAQTTGTNPLPEHCQIQGILQSRTGVSGPFSTPQAYGTSFEVRLPTAWNGRYMFQGGGGTEGSLPAATGSQTGTAGFPELRNGWAVASQNGGHQTSLLPPTLPATASSPSILQVNMFFTDPQAVKDWAYNSIDVTTQTANYLIDAYYGRAADRSYFVGCSTSGRQGMAMSQRFPTYYDGIIAGDPFYLPPDISLSETWGLEQIISISPRDANGNPIYVQGFPLSDQNLFTNAILAACDGHDGLVDGVIDDLAACRFDPETFVFPSSGPYGSIAPGQPLQCAGAKTPTCLTPAQVTATKKIADGPRTSGGRRIHSPDGTRLSGYPFDGGFMMPSGIPTRDIGTATTPPGNIGLGSGQLPLFWFTVPDPSYNPLTVNYDTDIDLVTASSPAINNSPDISGFVRRGGKLIFYHGLSDSGPPWPYTVDYFHAVERHFARHGAHRNGRREADDFMKLYLVPNMGHCGGNASTDRFDMLLPMVNWIENAVAPDTVVATGVNFASTLGTLTGLPTTRSRPLCPYPKTLRYTGPAGGDISVADNYSCVESGFDDFHERRSW